MVSAITAVHTSMSQFTHSLHRRYVGRNESISAECQENLLKIWKEVSQMLGWAITFFVIAIIAGLLGFTNIANTAVGIAKILFFLFLVLFVVFLKKRQKTTPPKKNNTREQKRSVFI